MITKKHFILSLAWLGFASIAPAAGEDSQASSQGEDASAAKSDNASSQGQDASAAKSDNASSQGQDASAAKSDNASSQGQDASAAKSDNSNNESASQASPIQSAARPYKLSIDAPVQLAGSDAAAKAFQTSVLPGMIAMEQKLLPEYRSESPQYLSSISFDPSKLVLSADSSARVYFLGEGAGYQNTLGISTTNAGPTSPGAALIFPNASSSVGFGGGGTALRSAGEPLLAGDFVDLGTLKAGTALDFFLIANGAVGGSDFVSTNQSLNKDGIVHAVAMSTPGSPYLIISFEDMVGGGDHDYNDVYFALALGNTNVAHLIGLGAPEPSLALGALMAGGALCGFGRRRRA
ncbi:MAG: DUF4114 domain-containing protein [Verrucomicrobiota bacterium]